MHMQRVISKYTNCVPMHSLGLKGNTVCFKRLFNNDLFMYVVRCFNDTAVARGHMFLKTYVMHLNMGRHQELINEK